jgi:aminodeoxyfutalosine deaminase
MSIQTYLRAAPKVELHVHLEGSIRPSTVLELARRNDVTLPHTTLEGFREWFRFRDFSHFIEVYGVVSRCLRTAEDYELIAYELASELARQNCRYAEVGFCPSFHAREGVANATYLRGLSRARDRARSTLDVEIAWVFEISRAMRGGETETMRWAEYTVGVAIEAMTEGVTALGLGGPEVGHPAETFAPFFERARVAGLHSYPHAGEHVGPASIRGALTALGAERIAHGVRAIEDPELVSHLTAKGIALDVCPTSNVRLGVYPSLRDHPLARLQAQGVAITVNSDDPALFDTTLNDEVATLADPFGLPVSAIDEILLNGLRYSFLSEPRKRQREATHRAELHRLKALHLA